jgi:tight adherence protein C
MNVAGIAINETTLAIIAGICVFVTLVAFAQALVPHDPMAARLKSHRKRRDVLRAELLSDAKPTGEKRTLSMGLLKELLDRLKLLRGEEARTTSDKLTQAGWRSRDALAVYLGVRLVLPFVVAFSTLFFVMTFKSGMSSTNMLMWVVGGGIAGYFIPVFGLKRMISRRQLKLRRQLPDGLDLLVICAEAGLSLDASLTRVAREIGFASPELADELGLTAVEIGFLPNRRQALMNLTKRTDLPPIRGVVNTLVQTERYGTPLAHSLRVLSAEFRDERMMKAEEKAAKLPAVLTVPMILFILPTLFMVLLGPAIINTLETLKN